MRRPMPQARSKRLPMLLLQLTGMMAAGLLAFGCSSGNESPPSAHAKSAPPSSTSSSTSIAAPTKSTTTHPATPEPISAYGLPAALGNTRPYWLLEMFSVPVLLGAGLSQTMLQEYFNTPQTFLIVKASDPAKDPVLPAATYVMDFHNYQQMVASISSGSIPSYVKLVLYDDEKWPSTPVAQQQQPFTYEAEAEALAHRHGLGLVFTPAANLSMVLSTAYSNATKYDGYTSLGIASQAATHTDVLDIQSQQDEATPGFNSFLSTAASQAQAANPQALVMAGLTTTTPSGAVTPEVLLNDYDSTRSLVSGYWLNVPGGSAGPKDPQTAVAFLQELAPQLGY